MTHEPECVTYDGGHLCVCDIIRKAYERGREDAANAAERELGALSDDVIEATLKWDNCDCADNAISVSVNEARKFAADLFKAVAAARGGEQA